MDRRETEIEMAARHVREAEAAVKNQEHRLARITSVVARERASSLLGIFQHTLCLHKRLLNDLTEDEAVEQTLPTKLPE